MNNALLVHADDGGSVFVLNAGTHLPEYTVCQPIRPQYGIFILNHPSMQHPDHGTFSSPSHCKQTTNGGNIQSSVSSLTLMG